MPHSRFSYKDKYGTALALEELSLINKSDLKCRVIMATREVSTKGSGNRTTTRRSEKALLSAEQ